MRKWIALLCLVLLVLQAAVPVHAAQALPQSVEPTVSWQALGLIALGSAAAGVAVAVLLVRRYRKPE